MKDYIEREAVLELLRYWADGYSHIEVEAAWAIRGITAIPTADVKPVVRGEWIDYKDEHQCSICRDVFVIDYLVWEHERYDFCPNCGSFNGGDGDDQH